VLLLLVVLLLVDLSCTGAGSGSCTAAAAAAGASLVSAATGRLRRQRVLLSLRAAPVSGCCSVCAHLGMLLLLLLLPCASPAAAAGAANGTVNMRGRVCVAPHISCRGRHNAFISRCMCMVAVRVTGGSAACLHAMLASLAQAWRSL
jgi:hypothetical protein